MQKTTEYATPPHLTVTKLKARNWTQGLIKKFLGAPDLIKTNPFYKNAGPMQLYLEERVIQIEQTQEFKAQLQKKQKHREISKIKMLQTNKKKREQLAKEIEELQIKIPNIPEKELLKRAIHHYNNLWIERNQYEKYASLQSPEEFLNRITVNYLRHCCTEYENILDSLYNQVGKQEAAIKLKTKILQAIAKKYPNLQKACEKI